MNLNTIKRNWRVLLLVTFLVLSLIFIRPQFGKEGVVISYVTTTSSAQGILTQGSAITEINGEKINDVTQVFKYYNKPAVVNGINISNFTGVDVKNPSSTNLNLGLELIGGTRVVLEPEYKIDAQTAQEIITTLETRVNSFGLKDFKFQIIKSQDTHFIQVEIAGGTQEEVKDLLEKQGKLEAKIPLRVALANGQGTLKLDSSHTVIANDASATVDGTTILVNKSNSTVIIEGIKFQYEGIISGNAILTAIVFSGPDIEISPDTSRSYVQGNEFGIGIIVSQESAERFAKITKTLQSVQGSLDSKLSFYLDDRLISSFNIASELKGRIIRDPSISGSRETQDLAIREKAFTESILKSGALPVKLEIVKSDSISPSLGNEFVKSTMIAGVVSLLAVFAVIYLRYRNLKISLLMMLTNTAEIVILLGIAARIGATIDLPAILGIIAVVGTGVNQLIIITDESRSKENISLKAKIKRGLFVIFGSAATVIATMFPLMVIGLGSIKSFALMTILGVLSAIIITRPAYAHLYERMIEKKMNN